MHVHCQVHSSLKSNDKLLFMPEFMDASLHLYVQGLVQMSLTEVIMEDQ